MGRVIEFPVFERYGDDIGEWLAALNGLNGAAPGKRTAARVAKSIGRTADSVERVRFSARHSSLGMFLSHAARALDASEFEGARYLLMTASASMWARPAGMSADHADNVFSQFPVEEEAMVVEFPATEIAVG